MRVKFELLNMREVSLGSADVSTSFGDADAVKMALRAIGHGYSECRWITYTIWDEVHSNPLCTGKMYILPWEEVS